MSRRLTARLISVLFLALFLGFLAVSGAVTFLKEKEETSFYENRALAAFPERTRQGMLDGSWFAGLNAYIQDQTAGRDTILRKDTFLNLRLLRRPVVNEIVVRGDTLLPWMDYWTADPEGIRAQAEAMADTLALHARQTEAAGGRFYFAAVPGQYAYFQNRYPAWLNNNAAHNALAVPALFSALADRWVAGIDAEERFDALGHPDALFSRIDHHFTIYGAYETYRAILERINADTGWDLDVLEEGEYSIRFLPNPYLGSRSRKLFGLWRSDERLGLLEQADPVPFTRTDVAPWSPDPMESAVLDVLPATDSEEVTYNVYMGGDMAMTEIRTDRPELPSILIYGDSYTNPVEGMLYRSFDTLWSLDLRHYDAMSLDRFIAEKQPDVVVCLRDYDAMLKAEGNGL